MKTNTQKDEEIGVTGPKQHSLAPGIRFRAPRHMLRRLTHESRRLAQKKHTNTHVAWFEAPVTWFLAPDARSLLVKALFCVFLV